MAEGSPGPMAGTATLVTGGIGRATTLGLAALGARVGITGRDTARTQAAAAVNHLAGSKLANVMFTYELARRLDGAGITATVLHPGVVRTAFAAEDQSLLAKVMITASRPFLKTPAKGAATSIYLASASEVEGVTGQYFANRRPKTSNKASYDTTAAARLWDTSARLTHSGGEAQAVAVLRPGRVRRGAD